MKKLLIIVVSLMLTCLSACGNTTPTYNPSKPYWLDENDFASAIVDVDETCTYEISYKEPTATNANTAVKFVLASGSYQTSLTKGKHNDSDCYVYTTTCIVSGEYLVTAGENAENKSDYSSGAFTDTTTSTTYFLWNQGFTFLYSEQTAQSTIPTLASGEKDDNGNRFVTIAYKTTVTYGERDAISTFEILSDKEKTAPYFSLKDGAQTTFKKYKKSNYIDSNMLYFFVRSFDFSNSISYSFSSIDVLNSSKHSMSLSVASDVATESVNLADTNLSIGGAPATESLSVFNMTIGINETYSGASVNCQYAEKTSKWHHIMYKMTSSLPYRMGFLVYTLTDYDHN